MTEIKHDRYGRYLLPHPDTGVDQPWTRATTLASSISDTYGLTKWKMRMVAKGIASRPDLYALAGSTPIEEKATLDKVAKDALEVAGGSRGANIGTSLHAWTAQMDRGEEPDVPAPWDADTDAYGEAIVHHGIAMLPKYIERTVCLPEWEVAGTLDRIVMTNGGMKYIADIKTGSVDYGWGEFAVQLAIYARASHAWTGSAWEPMIDVSKDRAIIMHLPVGQARCDLSWLDITDGWEMAKMASGVRAWWKRKDLAEPFSREHA